MLNLLAADANANVSVFISRSSKTWITLKTININCYSSIFSYSRSFLRVYVLVLTHLDRAGDFFCCKNTENKPRENRRNDAALVDNCFLFARPLSVNKPNTEVSIQVYSRGRSNTRKLWGQQTGRKPANKFTSVQIYSVLVCRELRSEESCKMFRWGADLHELMSVEQLRLDSR